ncbi:LCP family protein [Latilactobacillus curvatus]|uniref:LCP family glycopolymer transferase n=1 Tax=Latilactobacillus curvatus TaxID=28038 RepID=UPI002410A95B|nr:LCP family protein [Latilactobacillus curvatus]MDG2982017.1 LCP family protein [Latilactobacillus curvatus]MDT3394092.1 LCP family protein [Bacillota bacterium]
MNSEEPEMHREQHHHHHHKRRRKGWTVTKVVLAILGVLIIAGGAFAAKVYTDVNQTAKTVYKSKGKTQNKRKVSEKVELNKKTPFSILLLGTDTGELGRTEKGRTDTMILATVNPTTKETNMLSIARDSRVPIVGYDQTAKINAAYAYGGIPMAVNTVQAFMNVPVDYYVLMNMKGLEQLVDAVNGVTVNNKFAFDIDQYHFDKGTIHLDGAHALYYSRMRYSDSEGDFGRQVRQQEIIKAVLKKATSLNLVTSYNKFLQILENNMQTNLTLQDVINIQQNYGDSMNFKTLQLKGTGQMIDGQSFQVMNPTEVSQMSTRLRQQLDLK